MNIRDILRTAQNVNKETWNLDDGVYTGTIIEFKTVKEDTYVMLKIQVNEETIFMNYSSVSAYTYSPLKAIIEPFDETEDTVGKEIEFKIVNKTSKSGRTFSNITSVKYI